MKSATQAARDLLNSTLDGTGLRRAIDHLSKEAQDAYWALKKTSYFKAHNKVGGPIEKVSPLGRYKLVIEGFNTSKGSWCYSQGSVYEVGSDKPIRVIQRNYSAFPHSWVEDHPNGHDYLIAGESYQGQTVIELDTGRREDFLPKEAEEGRGFCWSSHEYNKAHQVLLVHGCYWACPYEYRIYDFSDPMNGWPQLKPIGKDGKPTYIEDDSGKAPVISDDGVVTVFQTRDGYDIKDLYEVEDDEALAALGLEIIPDTEEPKNLEDAHFILSKTTYKIEGGNLVYQSEWVSDLEKDYRVEQKRRQEAFEEAEAKFKAEDPLYIAYLEEVKDPVLRPEASQGRGYTYEGWHPEHKYEETRWCRRIYSPERKDKYDSPKGYTIDFEWAAKTGPVKLIIYKDGKTHDTKFWMGHSVESIRAAFAYAKALIQEAS